MEANESKKNDRKRDGFVGVLLIASIISLILVALIHSDLPGWILNAPHSTLQYGFIVIYPITYAFAVLSLAASAVLVRWPGTIRITYFISALFAALSALGSVAYAVGWWVIPQGLMVWQDYVCIALQAVACGLVVVALVKRGTRIAPLALFASFGCIVVSTLTFLLAPLFEPVDSVLMRALSLASPMAMLVFSEAYASDLGAVKNEA